MVADVGERLRDVLDADSGELEALYGAFFEEDWFRQQFTEGAGSDLLYLSEIAVEPGWKGETSSSLWCVGFVTRSGRAASWR
jgi:hypothetical protein